MRQLVRRVRRVGRIAPVVLQSRQRADEIAAGIEDREPGPWLAVHVAPRREQLMQRKPAGYALVARLLEAEAAVCEQLDRAPAGLLPPVPQVGRREPNIDLFSGRLAGENARGGFRDNQTRFI